MEDEKNTDKDRTEKIESFVSELSGLTTLPDYIRVMDKFPDIIGPALMERLLSLARGLKYKGQIAAAANICVLGIRAAGRTDDAFYRAAFMLEVYDADRQTLRQQSAAPGAKTNEIAELEEKFYQILLSVKAMVPQLLDLKTDRAFRLVSSIYQALMDRDAEQDPPDRIVATLEEARRLFSRAGSRTGEIWQEINLARAYIRLQQLDAAYQYAVLGAQKWEDAKLEERSKSTAPRIADTAEKEGNRTESNFPLPSKNDISITFELIAEGFYYQAKQFDRAISAAEWALRIHPESWKARNIQGNALLHLDQYEKAASVWKAAVRTHPEMPAAHLNLGIALTHLGRFDEALAALDSAVALRPTTPKYHFRRAETLQKQGRNDDALAGFAMAIALAENQQKQSGGAVDPRAEEPPEEVIGYARIGRIESLRALGRLPDALAECDALIGSGLDGFRSIGYQLRSGILDKQGDIEGALASLTEAIHLFPGASPSALMRHADLLKRHGDLPGVLADLREAIVQAPSARDYVQCVAAITEKLSLLTGQHPEDAGVWKTRGLAWFDQWYAARAIQDFSRALEIAPDDADTLYRRALAHIHSDSEKVPADASSAGSGESSDKNALPNEGRSFEHFFSALDDLGKALRLDPNLREARSAYRWLADRGLGEMLVQGMLLRQGDEPTGLFSVFPELREAALRHNSGEKSGNEGKLAEAIEDYLEAQAIARRNGFSIFALYLELRLADCYLRQYTLQKALDCLNSIQDAIVSAWTPLTGSLQEWGEKHSAEQWQKSGRQALIVEPDYYPFFTLGLLTVQNLQQVFYVQCYARLGDPDEARKHLRKVEDYFRPARVSNVKEDEISTSPPKQGLPSTSENGTGPKEDLAPGLTVQPMLGVVMALRDIREFDLAFEIMHHLEPLAGEEYAGSFASTMATLYAMTGPPEEEAKWWAKLKDLPVGPYAVATALNHAELLRRDGNAQDALDALDAIKAGESGWPLRLRERFWLARSYSLSELERWGDSFQAIQNAFAIDEQIRADLTRIDTRSSWHGQQEMLYENAALVGMMAEQTEAVYTLVERSRARALLDQLAISPLPLPPEAMELETIRGRILTQRGLLTHLDDVLKARGPEAIELETIRALEAAGFASQRPERRLVEEEHGVPVRVNASAVVEALRVVQSSLADVDEKIEAARLRHYAGIVGEPLSPADLRTLLSAVATPPNQVVLAEYYVTEDATLLFVARSDRDALEAFSIETGRETLRAFASKHFQRSRRYDEDEFQRFFAPFLAPLGESRPDGAPGLVPGDVVWFVPHDALHYVPLHAVRVNGETLMEHHSIAYTPSASILPYCLRNAGGQGEAAPQPHVEGDEGKPPNVEQRSGQNPGREYRSALIVGDTLREAPLPHAQIEARAVQRLFAPSATLLLGPHATRSEALRRLRGDDANTDVLHFACHGYFDAAQPMLSGLCLAPEASGDADAVRGNLTAQEIIGLRIHPGIVTLSACESGVSARKAGDELIGMMRALLYAGAPTLLLSLWQVDDTATGLLMQEFYRALKNSTGKANALRRAQMAVRDMPVREVIARCEEERAALEAAGEARLVRQAESEVAWLRFQARDYAAARSAFQSLLENPVDPREEEALKLAVWKCGAESLNLPIDYERRIYAHPWHWAAFVLVGDWK